MVACAVCHSPLLRACTGRPRITCRNACRQRAYRRRVTKLAAPRTVEEVLRAHGFSGERLLKLSRKIANDELRRRSAFLDHERLEDLVAYLALQGVQTALRYDPQRKQTKYGQNGGEPFASWMADILSHRVTDWYRSKAEGHGDRRYNLDGRIVLDGDMSYAEPADAFEREQALQRTEQGLDLDEAEQAITDRYHLSAQARAGLRLFRLRYEGHPAHGGEGSNKARKAALEEIGARR